MTTAYMISLDPDTRLPLTTEQMLESCSPRPIRETRRDARGRGNVTETTDPTRPPARDFTPGTNQITDLAITQADLLRQMLQMNEQLGGVADDLVEQIQTLMEKIMERLKTAANGEASTSESFAAALKGERRPLSGRAAKEYRRFLEGITGGRRRPGEHSAAGQEPFVEPTSSADFARQLTGGRR